MRAMSEVVRPVLCPKQTLWEGTLSKQLVEAMSSLSGSRSQRHVGQCRGIKVSVLVCYIFLRITHNEQCGQSMLLLQNFDRACRTWEIVHYLWESLVR